MFWDVFQVLFDYHKVHFRDLLLYILIFLSLKLMTYKINIYLIVYIR